MLWMGTAGLWVQLYYCCKIISWTITTPITQERQRSVLTLTDNYNYDKDNSK